MYLSLEKIINFYELDDISVNGKHYWTASLYLISQKPDFKQKIKIATYKRNYKDCISFYFNDVLITGIANWSV
jgi:hypothetical protein